MYIALGTTFPEAGGGYLWVRKGLGEFQGFLAGWLSWFAHGAAAGVYAPSFGYYGFETFRFLGGQVGLEINLLSVEKVVGAAVVIIFGYITWKGAKSSLRAGNLVGGTLIGILLLFIFSGLFKIFSEPAQSFAQYTPLLPHGFLGILVAILIGYAVYEILKDTVSALLGEEPDALTKDRILSIAKSTTNYDIKPHHLHLHHYGNHTEITMHIKLPSDMNLEKAHYIATAIEENILSELGIFTTLHMEPWTKRSQVN